MDIPSRVKRSGGKLYNSAAPGEEVATAEGRGIRAGGLPGRVDITERPQVVEDKRRVTGRPIQSRRWT